MRTWSRARTSTLCGYCHEPLGVGEPILLVTLPNVTRPRLRCERCEGPAPPDLPPLEPGRRTKTMQPIGKLAKAFQTPVRGVK